MPKQQVDASEAWIRSRRILGEHLVGPAITQCAALLTVGILIAEALMEIEATLRRNAL